MYVGRLAPSPTGALHLGNARTFLIAWLRCRSEGGRAIMRMEDLDHPKAKPRGREQAYEDLRWLGLDWDEGPDLGGSHAPYVQTERLGLYEEAFETLRRAGRLYACSCSRADIEAAQSAPHANEELHYPGTCRERALDPVVAAATLEKPPGVRFRVDDGLETVFADVFRGHERSCLSEWSGDFVVGRGLRPGYQLAVVVDDAAMGVTEVVRADDLVPSTHRQLVLYSALGLAPPRFLHVPLVLGQDGRRLAKRHGDTRVNSLRQAGVPAERLVGWLAASCGWVGAGEELTPSELLPHFQLESIPRDPFVVTEEALAEIGYRVAR